MRPLVADEASPLQELVYNWGVEFATALGWVESFSVQGLGDGRCCLTALAKGLNAIQESFKIAELCVGRHGPNDLVATLIAAGPMQRHADDFAVTAHVHHDPIQQTSDDLFP